ncbi:MAG: hypothetical protein ACLSWI_09820 [Candidatus Gastranaerophilaceae bacterium]
MRKNLFNLFLDKILTVPLWIKQAIYLKLVQEMKDYACEDFLRNHTADIFSTFVPTLTFKGKTEIETRSCGLDSNIYNFLEACANNYSMLEISVNTFLSMEEVAKYYELCLEQNFIKNPESKEIHAMAGFIAGKFRTGEYFKQRGTISVDQLQMAILNQKNALENGVQLKFGEVLSRLNFVGEDDMKALFILKEEAKKRFILDYNTVPKPEAAFADEKEKFETEISNLKEENIKLKRKMLQLLELVKRNAHQ